MGVVGAIGLFASIIFHEFSHSLVARRYGIPIKSITLFIFGGVAEMTDEPHEPHAEFYMAIAGPLASFFLAAMFMLLAAVAEDAALPVVVHSVLQYLGWVNGMLAVFNMVPAFPLDGGRVLRAVLWHRSGNLQEATKRAASIGSQFGLGFMFLGIFAFVTGSVIGGIWWFLIGVFMRTASASSYKQALMRNVLEGEPVSRFMGTDPICVSPDMSVRQLLENYFYHHHHKLFPVLADGQLLGQVTAINIKGVPAAQWDEVTVAEITEPVSLTNTIGVDEDAMQALSRMNRTQRSRLMVISPDQQLVGILTLKDMLDLFQLKVDLEEK